MKKKNVEFLDFNRTNKVVTKKTVIKKTPILITLLAVLTLSSFIIIIEYIKKENIFNLNKNDIVQIKDAYTSSKNGRNLTFYDDGTFSYMNLENIKKGTYIEEENKYILNYDNSTCEFIKNVNIISSTCPLIMEQEDNDYMASNNVQITKLLYSVNSDEFDKISNTFLEYINALSVTKKYPSLKASRTELIKNCFSLDNLKTFTCSINYIVIPDEADLTKSKWLENGETINGTIKKFHYVTIENKNNTYKFKTMSTSL